MDKKLKKGEKVIQFTNNGQICVLTNKGRLLCQKPVYANYVDNNMQIIQQNVVIGYDGFFEIK